MKREHKLMKDQYYGQQEIIDQFFTSINPNELSTIKQDIQQALTECKTQLNWDQGTSIKNYSFDFDNDLKTFPITELTHLKLLNDQVQSLLQFIIKNDFYGSLGCLR